MRTVGGVVTALARKYTKRGDLMATFVLEDLGGAVEVMVFPKTMAQLRRAARRGRDRLREGAHRHARGRAEAHRDGDHAAAARASTAASRCASGPGPACSTTPKVDAAEGGAARSTRATARCSCTSRARRRRRSSRSATSTCVTDRNGLFAELRVLLGADCILAAGQAQRGSAGDDRAGSRRRARPGRAGRGGARPTRRTRGRRRAGAMRCSTSVLVEERAARDAGAHRRVEVRLGPGPVRGEEAVAGSRRGPGRSRPGCRRARRRASAKRRAARTARRSAPPAGTRRSARTRPGPRGPR